MVVQFAGSVMPPAGRARIAGVSVVDRNSLDSSRATPAWGVGCEYMRYGIQSRFGRYRSAVVMHPIAIAAAALLIVSGATPAFGQGEGLRSSG